MTSTLSLCKVLPASTRLATVSSSSGKPCPVNVEVTTKGAPGHIRCTSPISTCRSRSALLITTTTGLRVPLPIDACRVVSALPPKPIAFSSSETCRSCPLSGSAPSNTSSTTSALSAALRLRSTPICSTGSPPGVMPAVSMRCSGIPRRFTTSSTVSRVVPAMGVTIARSLRSRALSKLDLPTLGLPIIVVRSPCRYSRPCSEPESNASTCRRAIVINGRSSSGWGVGTSSSGKSMLASMRATTPRID